MPKHKLKPISAQLGRLCRKACRSLIAKMAPCRFRRWAWMSLFILLLAGGLLGGFFTSQKAAAVASDNFKLSSIQSSPTELDLKIEYLGHPIGSSRPKWQQHTVYLTTTAGNCPTWSYIQMIMVFFRAFLLVALLALIRRFLLAHLPSKVSITPTIKQCSCPPIPLRFALSWQGSGLLLMLSD